MNSVPALTQAIIDNNAELVKQLIAEGCDVNQATDVYKPAVSYAVGRIFILLLEANTKLTYTKDSKVIDLITNEILVMLSLHQINIDLNNGIKPKISVRVFKH